MRRARTETWHRPSYVDFGARRASAIARHHVTIGVMGPQQFRAVIVAGPGGRAVIAVPFDPDETWGAKADHPVGGTIDGRQVRGQAFAGRQRMGADRDSDVAARHGRRDRR